MSDTMLSKNFKESEFHCRCGLCAFPGMNPKLINGLQKLRDSIGRAIKVTSGYRCPRHNMEIGGHPKSQHLRGNAADIKVRSMKPHDLMLHAMEIKEFEQGGIGIYDTFVHVDVGPRRRWDKRTT